MVGKGEGPTPITRRFRLERGNAGPLVRNRLAPDVDVAQVCQFMAAPAHTPHQLYTRLTRFAGFR